MSRDTGWVDRHGEVELSVFNSSGLSAAEIDPHLKEVATQLDQWVKQGRAARANRSSLFSRDRFAAPDSPYEQMKVARMAVSDDDVLGATADVLESLMFQEVSWESSNDDAADIFNQISAKIDLDTYLRVAARELFTYSQTITAAWWDTVEFTPRGKPNEASKRKSYPLLVPTKLVTLDPQCVIPVGTAVFGDGRLAWSASKAELEAWESMEQLQSIDPTMAELFKGRYIPENDIEKARIANLGFDPLTLLELRRDRVWRHTLTKSSFDMFADNRLKPTFVHLDLKQQLFESDRVTLVGAANFIILVKKGSDANKAMPQELDALKQNFASVAKIPIIISDHRLEIEIITPKIDHTLDADRYDLLDARILSSALRSLEVKGTLSGDAGGQIRTRAIARTLENRRRQLRRTVQAQIRDAIWNHPMNKKAIAELCPKAVEKPSLAFNPRNVQVDNDSQVMQQIWAMRQSREISRHSLLEFYGLDQSVEAQRLAIEKVDFDPIFKTIVPFDGQSGGDRGDEGGRPTGGGSPKKSGDAVKPSTSSGASKKAK